MSTTPAESTTWFATEVVPRHEKAVRRMLDFKGYRTSLPMRKTAHSRRCGTSWESEKPLISGYVFVSGDYDNKLRVISTPGVLRIVGFDGHAGLIPHSDIEALERVAASPLPAAECGYFKLGDSVRLTGGPLKGLQGSVVREPKGARFVVRVDMLQRSVAVEIDGTWAEPVRDARAPLPVAVHE